jgi:hypothetical protein
LGDDGGDGDGRTKPRVSRSVLHSVGRWAVATVIFVVMLLQMGVGLPRRWFPWFPAGRDRKKKKQTETVGLLPALPEGRAQRFPRVHERIRTYLGAYAQDNVCPTTQPIHYHRINETAIVVHARHDDDEDDRVTLTTELGKDQTFLYHQETVEACAADEQNRAHRYCTDALTIGRTLQQQQQQQQSTKPLLTRFSDEMNTYPLPVFQSFRDATRIIPVGDVCQSPPSPQPILWKLNVARHYGGLGQVWSTDLPWRDKKNQAVFRGALTGFTRHPHADDETNCRAAPRCRLVLQQQDTNALVDAKLVDGRIRDKLNSTIVRGVNLMGQKLKIPQLLQYKALIFLEGNDVSSGLKWGLLSRSVVMMPLPTKTAWAMEELLEPWVHYIPVQEDLSDAAMQMQWVLEHDREAQAIAHRGSLWIQDLVYHGDAAGDDQDIMEAILQRYQTFWIAS